MVIFRMEGERRGKAKKVKKKGKANEKQVKKDKTNKKSFKAINKER
jgi:hypothetical protein